MNDKLKKTYLDKNLLEIQEENLNSSFENNEKQFLKEENFQFNGSLSFHGNFSHTIDSKFRVNLPSEYRKVLLNIGDNSVVITNYVSEGARCLEGFTLSSWMEFENKLKSKSRFDSKLQRLENFYLSRAAHCQLDKSGRILIPEYLRTYAGITKDITFTSSIHGFRVWDTRVWNYVFSESEKALLENPDLFSEIDI